MAELKAILQLRTGSYDEFYDANLVYAPGEHTHVTSGSHAGKWKVGDGITAWRVWGSTENRNYKKEAIRLQVVMIQ
jgi:hypothetical protein